MINISDKIKIPEYVIKVMNMLETNGFEAFVVGGCVRNCIMGIKPHDWDMCTSATPAEVKQILNGIYPVIPTGEKYGTVTVLVDGKYVELTTYRTDGAYGDSRHPDYAEFVPSVDLDLARRDFTINAMAFNPKSGLVDLFGGLRDIEASVLRCVGDPSDRFNEDALRIMRALRFAAVYNLKIESKTASAIFARAELLKNISAERIYSELKKILSSDKPACIFKDFRHVFEKVLGYNFDSEYFSGVFLKVADALPADVIMRASALFGNLSSAEISRIASKLKFENSLKSGISFIISNQDIEIPPSRVGLKRLMYMYGSEKLLMLLKFKKIMADALDSGKTYDDELCLIADIIDKCECVSLHQLAISGSDLISLGLSSGPKIGLILDELLRNVIEGSIPNEYDALVDFVRTGKI